MRKRRTSSLRATATRAFGRHWNTRPPSNRPGIRERAGRRSVALHTNIDNRLGQIQADERTVRQVVLNLLSNAIKFTPEGGRIEVAATPKGRVRPSLGERHGGRYRPGGSGGGVRGVPAGGRRRCRHHRTT